MANFGDLFQTGDWKGEKHVPVIHCPEKVKAGEAFEIKVSIGDAIPHPNTQEHHIVWIKLYFFGEGSKFPVELARFNFSVHGEDGAFTEPAGLTKAKLSKSGKIYAVSYCNIHGLWQNNVDITVE